MPPILFRSQLDIQRWADSTDERWTRQHIRTGIVIRHERQKSVALKQLLVVAAELFPGPRLAGFSCDQEAAGSDQTMMTENQSREQDRATSYTLTARARDSFEQTDRRFDPAAFAVLDPEGLSFLGRSTLRQTQIFAVDSQIAQHRMTTHGTAIFQRAGSARGAEHQQVILILIAVMSSMKDRIAT